jgi:hypothetical protein
MAGETGRLSLEQDAATELRRCVRERMRIARELAALRAGLATLSEHYERVVRSMHALGPTLGITQSEIGRATDPDWGPAALLRDGEDRFLKHEPEVADRLLNRLP